MDCLLDAMFLTTGMDNHPTRPTANQPDKLDKPEKPHGMPFLGAEAAAAATQAPSGNIHASDLRTGTRHVGDRADSAEAGVLDQGAVRPSRRGTATWPGACDNPPPPSRLAALALPAWLWQGPRCESRRDPTMTVSSAPSSSLSRVRGSWPSPPLRSRLLFARSPSFAGQGSRCGYEGRDSIDRPLLIAHFPCLSSKHHMKGRIVR